MTSQLLNPNISFIMANESSFLLFLILIILFSVDKTKISVIYVFIQG